MHNLIMDGPPVINAVSHTEDPGFKAHALCTVDGYAAEVSHDINTRRQEYNSHVLRVFDARTMEWKTVLSFGHDEMGHIPIHPEPETIGALRGISEVMWSMANVIVAQSRLRQEELDRNQFANEHMHYQGQLDSYLDERMDVAERVGENVAIERGEMVTEEALDDLRAKLAGDA